MEPTERTLATKEVGGGDGREMSLSSEEVKVGEV